jgi:hypothetical protein
VRRVASSGEPVNLREPDRRAATIGPVAVEPAEDVLVHREEGEAFLLHVGSGRYFGLNPSGLVIWDALVAGLDPVAQLEARWPDMDRAAGEADVAALVDGLLEAGLVRTRDERDEPG